MQSGSAPTRSSRSLLAVVVLLSAAACLACAADIPQPEPEVVRLLPGNDAVRRWETYPGTLVYGAGVGLTDIYNGGYELYTDNGVLDAAQQMYRSVWRSESMAVIAVHRMASSQSAQEFFEYWQTPDSRQPSFRKLNLGDASYVYVADGSVYGYMVQDGYFVTVSLSADDARSKVVVREYLKTISAGIVEVVAAGRP